MPLVVSQRPPSASGPVLPAFVRDYLAGGAAEGARNDTIYRVAQQFHAAGVSQAECEGQVLPVAIGQGGEKVRAEVLKAIKSGYASTKVTEPILGHASSPQPRAAASLPTGPLRDGAAMLAALAAAFAPGEHIAICPAHLVGEDWKPGAAVIHSLEGWQKRLPAALDACPGGCFIAINPLKAGATRRTRDDVAAFRHVLVEWETDKHGLFLDQQEALLRECGYPVTVIVSSGGRSVHGWVRVDAPDLPTWERRRDEVFTRMKCDTKNKDVSRVSRLPGFMRGEREQALLGLNIGAKTDGLPAMITLLDLLKEAPAAPPEVIKGALYQGTKMMLGAPSKARKSWALLDLALSVAIGVDWIGFEVTKGPVLYVNFELLPFMLYERLAKISKGRRMVKFAEGDANNLHFWNLRGKIHDIAALMPPLLEKLRKVGYILVIFDPVYKGLGARDENDASDINDLMNHLEQAARETGAAVVFAHHFAKGNSAEKHALDRVSGSGVWARDVDTSLVFTPPPPKMKAGEKKPEWDYEVDVTARAHPRINPFHVFWKGAHYEREDGPRTVEQPEDDSLAGVWGKVLAEMPPLSRAAAEEWLKAKMGGSIEDARRAFDNLRKDRYRFVQYLSEQKMWVGFDHKTEEVF